jgi:hypothetical protein
VGLLRLVLEPVGMFGTVASFLFPTPRKGASWWHCGCRGCSPNVLCVVAPIVRRGLRPCGRHPGVASWRQYRIGVAILGMLAVLVG